MRKAAEKSAAAHGRGSAPAGRGKTGAGNKGDAGDGAAGTGHEATEWTAETIGDIPAEVQTTVDGQDMTAYPALEATPHGVRVKYHPTKAAADTGMFGATLKLLLKATNVKPQQMVKGLPLQQRVAVDNYPHGGAQGLVNDCQVAATRDLLVEEGGPVRSPKEFAALRDKITPKVAGRVRQYVVALAPGLVEYGKVAEELKSWDGPAIEDMQLSLIHI